MFSRAVTQWLHLFSQGGEEFGWGWCRVGGKSFATLVWWLELLREKRVAETKIVANCFGFLLLIVTRDCTADISLCCWHVTCAKCGITCRADICRHPRNGAQISQCDVKRKSHKLSILLIVSCVVARRRRVSCARQQKKW